MMYPLISMILSLLLQSPAAAPLHAEIVVNAPVDEVWEAYTTRAGVLAWQVENTSPIELAVGATWRTSYDPASDLDDDTVIENEILAFDPGRMLAVRTIRAPSDFPFPNAIHDAWSVLYLEPVGDAQTRVTVRMFGYTDSEESQQMRAFFEWGNPYELNKLAEYFAAR